MTISNELAKENKDIKKDYKDIINEYKNKNNEKSSLNERNVGYSQIRCNDISKYFLFLTFYNKNENFICFEIIKYIIF